MRPTTDGLRGLIRSEGSHSVTSSKRWRGAAVALGALVSVIATEAEAQTTGGIAGTIIDANSQNPVADAVVIATSPSLQGEQTAVTDASGNFEITLLPAGV